MIRKYPLEGVVEITPKKFGDDRGFFSETYNSNVLKDLGLNLSFVQDNHSLSAEIGTLRGLHFQKPPFAQDKLVRVVSGAILDVAVDIRKNSPTYGEHVSVEISADKWNQLLVPKGFAHGFITLTANTEVIYKVTNFYSAENDCGVSWDDPDLNIDWGIEAPKLSTKDAKQPSFKEINSPF